MLNETLELARQGRRQTTQTADLICIEERKGDIKDAYFNVEQITRVRYHGTYNF